MQNESRPIKPFLGLMIFIYAFILGIETGAASFVSVVVFPVWASSPEAAIGFVPEMPYHFEEGDFFMYASSSTMLAAIITLIAGWRAPAPLKKWIWISSIGFIIIFIWSIIYFVPVQDTTLKGGAGAAIPREELDAKLKMFVGLNYVRVAALYIFLAASLYALKLSSVKRINLQRTEN